MIRTLLRTGLLAALTLCAVASAQAHHSFAPYEPEKQIRLRGVVETFTWQNPHVYIELRGAELGDDGAMSGEEALWLIECANPGILNRVGWRFNMVKEGDEVTLIVAPMRNGQPAALLKAIRLPNGEEHGNGGPAGVATIPLVPGGALLGAQG